MSDLPSDPPPATWHHGLIARWWAEFNSDGDDIAWFQAQIERGGEPALDLGCGTGRLLVPFLKAGLDVEGCDISQDMLAYCRSRAEAEGLSPRLLCQPMHALDAQRTYQTIVICGSFGIGGTRNQDLETLCTVHRHLAPGGVLAFDLYLPNFDPRGWKGWLPEGRKEMPMAWPRLGDRRRATDGTELELHTRLLEFDPLEQTALREIRARHWVEGELASEEQHSIRINIYFKNEVELMLEHAGFRELEVEGDVTGREAVAFQDAQVMFVARK